MATNVINFYRFLYSLKTSFLCHFDKRYKTGYVLIFRSFHLNITLIFDRGTVCIDNRIHVALTALNSHFSCSKTFGSGIFQ
jgi:hypothetical protein